MKYTKLYLLSILFLAIVFIMIGCKKKVIDPYKANFEMLTLNDTTYFTNTSTFGTSFLWDNGKGQEWNRRDMKTDYQPGTYKIKLIAIEGNISDTCIKMLEL